MPLSDPLLWDNIATWTLPHRRERDDFAEPPRTCASFEDCLRKKGDWTDESARRITMAYRRFLYLKALSGEVISPSDVIDGAWHLHLSFPQDYRALCAAVGRDIPHHTDLAHVEELRAYERGRALYESEFDAPPDRDLWPSVTARRQAELQRLATVGAIGMGVVFFITGAAAGGVAGWLAALGGVALVASALRLGGRRGPVKPTSIARCG